MTNAWFRIHRCLLNPIYFGTSGSYRYDAPDGEYGVLYAGRDRFGALMETVGTFRGPGGRIVVGENQLRERCFARIETGRPLRVVNLTDGASLARLGADARLWAGDYALSQAWSLALWSHPEQPDGLIYRARHAPERLAVAIFDRAADTLTSIPRGSLLEGRNRKFVFESLERARGAVV